MSRHKNRSKSNDRRMQNSNPLGLNSPLLSMLGLGDIDMGQLSGLFNAMSGDGFDLNSLNFLFDGGQQGQSNLNNDRNNMNNTGSNMNIGGIPGFDMGNMGGMGWLFSMLGGLGNNNNMNPMNNNMNSNMNSMNNNQGNMNNGQGDSTQGTNNFTNPLNDLNMNDLESMFSSFSTSNPKSYYDAEPVKVDNENIIDVDLENDVNYADPNLSMLKSLKDIVNPEREKFIDRVIEMYKKGEINY